MRQKWRIRLVVDARIVHVINDKGHRRMTEITQLPIYKYQDEISRALAEHQVIVVEGPTGCGKTTQLPRILLRNPMITGKIGLTQPRRIAAVSVAYRIAKEIGCQLGEEVGYAIRFDDKTGADTVVKVMTDGILLQESRTDQLYSQYQVIIIDEAHERSLNIDLALGLLRMAIEKRPELRVIISSATIRAETFQKYFSKTGDGKDVPLISIQARTYPVEIEYRGLDGKERDEMPRALTDEVRRIHLAGNPGHILCFLPGQRAIVQCQEMLQTIQATERGYADLWILPLYGQLSREDQERVFEERPGMRKVVLATNIAETSITIPDVRYVIDSGIAKIPRFNNQTHVTALREEGVSLASLQQRAGRAGRTAPGKCIRLFAESKLGERPEFTDEEITRLELSEVLLRLIDIGITDVASFPFLTRPPKQAIEDALDELVRLGAVDKTHQLTKIGQKMVVFPLSPRLARVVVEAGMKYPGVLSDVIVAVSWLSVKSPLLYPPDHENQAKRAHAKFAHPMGDLLTGIGIVHKYVDAEYKKEFCKKNYLDSDTMAFVAKSSQQIEELAENVGIISQPGGQENDIIRAFLSAYGDQCLVLKGRSYITPENINVVLHPSSVLYESMPKLIMALEFIQSTRTYAEQASVVRAAWLKEYGISVNLSPSNGGASGNVPYQEFGANRKKMRRFEKSCRALGYAPEAIQKNRAYDAKSCHSSATVGGRRLFRVQTPVEKKPETTASARATLPETLTIGGAKIRCVTTAHRQPLLIMTLDDLQKIVHASSLCEDKNILNYRTSLRDNFGKYEILRNFRLAELPEVAKNLHLLDGSCTVPDDIPMGASLSINANLKVLLRALPYLGRCILGTRGKNGWLTLAGSEEIFWFELNDKVSDALDISVQTLQMLAEFVEDSQALERIAGRAQTLDAELKKMRAVIAKNY